MNNDRLIVVPGLAKQLPDKSLAPNAEQTAMQVQKAVAIGDQNVRNVGAVSNQRTQSYVRGLPDVLTFICDNSASSTASEFVIFDYFELYRKGSSTIKSPTVQNSYYPSVVSSSGSNTIAFSGINQRIITGAALAFIDIKVNDMELDGTFNDQQIIRFAPSIRNNAYNDKVATVEKSFFIDGYKSLSITVPASTRYDFDLFVSALDRSGTLG